MRAALPELCAPLSSPLVHGHVERNAKRRLSEAQTEPEPAPPALRKLKLRSALPRRWLEKKSVNRFKGKARVWRICRHCRSTYFRGAWRLRGISEHAPTRTFVSLPATPVAKQEALHWHLSAGTIGFANVERRRFGCINASANETHRRNGVRQSKSRYICRVEVGERGGASAAIIGYGS